MSKGTLKTYFWKESVVWKLDEKRLELILENLEIPCQICVFLVFFHDWKTWFAVSFVRGTTVNSFSFWRTLVGHLLEEEFGLTEVLLVYNCPPVRLRKWQFFYFSVYDIRGAASDRNVVVLNDIHIDIMDYIEPASCSDAEFRQMWAEFEWENKVAYSGNFETALSSLVFYLWSSSLMRLRYPKDMLT